MLSTLDIVLLIGYALICLGIGLFSSRKQKDEDFMIAGRKMGLWGFTASVVASYIGGAAIVAYTAYVFQFGISAIAVFLGTAAGFLVFIPYARKIRRISGDKKFHTLSDWFYHKFGKTSGVLSANILFVVYLGMLLNQFIAGSSILASISGWSYEESLLLSSGIILVYLAAGGFSSVIKTDIFQYMVLLVMFIFMAYILISEQHTRFTAIVDLSAMDPGMTIAFIAFGVFIIFQSAEYWQRVYAARDEAVVRKGLTWSAALVILTGIAITLVGIAAREAVPGMESRNAFSEGMKVLLPESMHGIGLVLIFAAIMSSADTIIFVLASSLAKDYHHNWGSGEAEQHKLMKYTRIFIIALSISGAALAWFFRDLVAVIVFITGVGFTIIPAAIASFHTRLHPKAVTISFITGTAYVLILYLAGYLIPEASIASILVSAATLLIASRILRTKQTEP